MTITDHNYESHALDYIENTLRGEHRRAFDAYLAANPERAAEIRAMQAELPVFTADESVRFEGKALLLRRNPIRVWVLRTAAAAALVAAGIWAAGNLRQEPVEPMPVQTAALRPIVLPDLPVAAVPEPVTVEPAVATRAEPVVVRGSVPGNTFQVALAPVERREVVLPTVQEVLPAEALDDRIARLEWEIAAWTPEPTGWPDEESVGIPDGLLAVENERLGFLNLLNRDRMKRLTVGIITPILTLNPVRVHRNDEEKIVELATITISRREMYP